MNRLALHSFVDSLEKTAGGGARTQKSFVRAIRRWANAVAKDRNLPADDVFKELMGRSTKTGLLHGFHPKAGKGLKGKHTRTTGGHATAGGHWPTEFANTPEEMVHHIPFREIRKMRGRFGADNLALLAPLSDMPPAVLFRGDVGRAPVSTLRSQGRKAKKLGLEPIPERLTIDSNYPFRGIEEGALAKGDALLQLPYINKRRARTDPFGGTWSGLRHEMDTVADVANTTLPGAYMQPLDIPGPTIAQIYGDRPLIGISSRPSSYGRRGAPSVPTPVSAMTTRQRRERLAQLQSKRIQSRIPSLQANLGLLGIL